MAEVLLRAVSGHSSCGNMHRDPEENVGDYTSVLWCKNASAEPFQEIDCFSISPRDYLGEKKKKKELELQLVVSKKIVI